MSRKKLNNLIIPILKTERLRLEPIAIGHSKGMFALWSSEQVCKYSGIVKDYDGNIIETPVSNKKESDKIIEFWLRALSCGWGFRWGVILETTNEFIGTIGFNSLSSSYEIAYHLLPKYWGNGVMTEASTASIG